MRINYNCKKGNRVKKGSTKVEGKRYSNFCGLTVRVLGLQDSLYWCESLNKWVSLIDNRHLKLSSSNRNIKTLKSAISHVKRHDEIPKGTKCIFISVFEGVSNIIITK